jgi:gamma-glutamyltranspeptidase/glutathione hydrolase
VHPSSCGLGGGGFALVHDAASGRDAALDYRETAPAATLPELYRTDGKPDPSKLRTGGLAIGVPGEAAGLVTLHRRFGRLPFARVLEPAARLARDGFPLGDAPHLAREIERSHALLAADPGLRATYLAPDGTVPGPAFRIVQADLARALDTLRSDGDASFYRGSIATAIVDATRARGGVLTAADLAGYRPVWRDPLRGHFRGRRIVTFPPPGSGGVSSPRWGCSHATTCRRSVSDRRPPCTSSPAPSCRRSRIAPAGTATPPSPTCPSGRCSRRSGSCAREPS